MNRNAAVRNARTMITGAQNGGRQKSYSRASAMGIAIEKEWMSANDGRVRDSHMHLNGVRVKYNETFPNGCMYPGDSRGAPCEVYNCRCTMVAITPHADQTKRTGNTAESYKAWKERKSDNLESDLGTFKQKLRSDENISKEYYSTLKKKFAQGNEDAKRVFAKYASGDTIEDSSYEGVAHYNTKKKKISMHYGADTRNERGAGVAWFHEHGHLIDDALNTMSNDDAFKDLLKQDALNYRLSYGKRHKLGTYSKIDKAISNELQDMRTDSAISDLLEGITKGNIRGIAGHGKIENGKLDLTYWENSSNITSEAFAHMFEAQFDDLRYSKMKEYFPKSLNYFEKKIKGGSKGMIKKLEKAHTKFVLHFHYCPEFPPNIDFDEKEFAELLLKCVTDDFDYTIEKYGTVVPKKMPLPEIIYD